jgi:histone-lysine N-methyltransferase SETMAR
VNGCEKKRTEMWKNGSWILHHDNEPAHKTLSVETFLAKHKIPGLEHPPYSPDLAPCFSLFTKINSALEGTRFESVDAVKAKTPIGMKKPSEKDLWDCFQQWKIKSGAV